ncbi:MAG: hypothetical protein IPP61_00620 [Cytophagaceae bacterium]|nr:hypothetical protein [Cytophagaceae bacterium]
MSELLNIRLVSDQQEKQNDWVRGKRDIKSEKVIIDIKSTWDFNTFGQHLIESNEEFYFRQLDNYMELWGINEALLAYVLVDTPIHLINQEVTNKNYKMQFLDNAEIFRIPELQKSRELSLTIFLQEKHSKNIAHSRPVFISSGLLTLLKFLFRTGCIWCLIHLILKE